MLYAFYCSCSTNIVVLTMLVFMPHHCCHEAIPFACFYHLTRPPCHEYCDDSRIEGLDGAENVDSVVAGALDTAPQPPRRRFHKGYPNPQSRSQGRFHTIVGQQNDTLQLLA